VDAQWDGRWNYAVGIDCFHHRDGEKVLDGEVFVFKVTPQKVLAFTKDIQSYASPF